MTLSATVRPPAATAIRATGLLSRVSSFIPQQANPFALTQSCGMASLLQMHRNKGWKKKRKKYITMDGHPLMKGLVLKVMVKKPKKPNSANRKCVRVKLSSGREATAYIPGIGHNLQEHHIVLVRGGRVQDCPGIRLKCVRGAYDLQHVKK